MNACTEESKAFPVPCWGLLLELWLQVHEPSQSSLDAITRKDAFRAGDNVELRLREGFAKYLLHSGALLTFLWLVD